MIKEIIVVEGKDDVAAIKRAVDAEIITTNGFGFPDDLMDRIEAASKKRGIIIFTDPDFAGEKIRGLISKKIKNCKHAFLPRDKATKDGNIGIENAKPEDIIEALNNAKAETENERNEFCIDDLVYYNLIGNENASNRRAELGKILKIGKCNSKQFLKRINNYSITREELEQAVRRLI
ncbi:ribonuclease M5 [Abyssisolibacter fermentans]|uniref:ribonuclease M5 n=1 Tax=Abyssisolibacter fermentans TaxID=1766203 RepID=UPI0008320D52|nr:ribonuclease M5 [Abyssisolibacter fermentans]